MRWSCIRSNERGVEIDSSVAMGQEPFAAGRMGVAVRIAVLEALRSICRMDESEFPMKHTSTHHRHALALVNASVDRSVRVDRNNRRRSYIDGLIAILAPHYTPIFLSCTDHHCAAIA